MTRSTSNHAKQEASPLRSYSSVAASIRPTLESSVSSQQTSQSPHLSSNQTPDSPVTKRKPSRSNIPKPISTSAANSKSKCSLAPSTASSNKEVNNSPVTPVNHVPSQSLDPSLVTAFVEPTSDALHAARARKPSVSGRDGGSRLTYKGSNNAIRGQTETSRDVEQSKRNSGEWRARVRKQTGMDFTSNLEVGSNSTSSLAGLPNPGSQQDPSKEIGHGGKGTATFHESQTHRGLKRSLSPAVPLATSFAEETNGIRARSASIHSVQYPFQQASSLNKFNTQDQLVPSSSRTDLSGSSYNARLHRVSSEVTLDRRRMGGDDGEDVDSSPPSTPSHLSGFHKANVQSGGTGTGLALSSRPRATTIASLGGTALPATESLRRARAGTLFNPIGSLSTQSLHSLAEGISTSEVDSPSYGTTPHYRALLQPDEAARRSRSGSTGEESTSSSFSQGQSLGDGEVDSEESYVESSLENSLAVGNRSYSSLRSSGDRSRDSPDTSNDSYLGHSLIHGNKYGEDESSSMIAKLGRPRSMTSSQQPKGTGVYLPPALRHRTFTASGSFLRAPPSTREDDIFSLQVENVSGNESGIDDALKQAYSAPRRQTISTADKPDRSYLSVSRPSYGESENNGSSSGRSSRLDYNNESIDENQKAGPPTRFRSHTTSRECLSSSLLHSVPSIKQLNNERLRSNLSPRFNLSGDSDRSSNTSGSVTAKPSEASTPATPGLPTCDLCAAQVKSLVCLLPCRHLACAACCSTGVSQTAACPARQHLCAACQEPVESIELSLPPLTEVSSSSSQVQPKMPASPAAIKASPSPMKSSSFLSGKKPESLSRDSDNLHSLHLDNGYGAIKLEGEALERARANIVVVRMDNIPWELCYTDVDQWVPQGTLANQASACPVHITIELMTGKTNNTCFLECADLSAAQKLIRSRNNAPLLGRAVTLYTTTRKELLSDVLHEFLEKNTDNLGPCKFGRREMNGIQTLLNSGGSLLKGTVKPLEFFTSIVGLLPEINGGLSAEQGRVLFETTKDILSLLEERVNDPGHLRDSIRRLVETSSRSDALTPLQRLSLCAQGETIFKERIISKSYKNSLFATFCTPNDQNDLSISHLNFDFRNGKIQTPEIAAQNRAGYFSPSAQSPVSPSTTLSSLGVQTPGGPFGIQHFSSPNHHSYDQGGYDSHSYPLMTSPAQAASPRNLENFYPFQPSSPVCGPRSPPLLTKSNSYCGRGPSNESSLGGMIYGSSLSSHPGLGLYQPMGLQQDLSQHPIGCGTSSNTFSPNLPFNEGSERVQQTSLLPAWNQGNSSPNAPFTPLGFSSNSPINYGMGGYSPSNLNLQDQIQHQRNELEKMSNQSQIQNHLPYHTLSSPSRNSLYYQGSNSTLQEGYQNQQFGNLRQQPLQHQQHQPGFIGGEQSSAQIQSDLNHLNAVIAQLQLKKSMLGGGNQPQIGIHY